VKQKIIILQNKLIGRGKRGDKMVILACPFREALCNEGQVVIGYERYICRAWKEAAYGCKRTRECPIADTGPCMTDNCLEMIKAVCKPGYCRLIVHE
jgi:hypothetical protein